MGARAITEAFPSEDVVEVINASGTGDFVLVCEHASNVIPAAMGNLGLSSDDLEKHYAYDIGALGLAKALSDDLDAPLVASRISRLVYDCNRPPEAPSAIPPEGEGVVIPGNVDLSETDRAARAGMVYWPFHDALATVINDKRAVSSTFSIVTVHSFTPVFKGVQRDVHLGVLHDADTRLADSILVQAEQDGEIRSGRNAPYGPGDGVMHTLKTHAIAGAHPNVMLEVRNDLIRTGEAHREWAARLSGWLKTAVAQLKADGDVLQQTLRGQS
jgi:predicted N-formylglutamate amidohydrolase